MEKETECSKKIFTIPNIMSLFRLALVPILLYLYFHGLYAETIILFLVSGATDIIDGYIARHFNMVSELGKALDPVADKLTQIAMLFCLIAKFEILRIPCLILIVKEILSGTLNLAVAKHTGTVPGADWHGKLSTVFIYATLFTHLVWPGIPENISMILVIISSAIMILSFSLYFIKNVKKLLKK